MKKLLAILHAAKAGWILSREGVLKALPLEQIKEIPAFIPFFAKILAKKNAKNSKRSENLARAIHRLGPTYVKLAQFLATRPDLIGKELAQELSLLQDQAEQFSQIEAIAQIENSLGKKIDDTFLTLGPAIAAASMAQVHQATAKTKDGKIYKYAVKVIRPDIRKRFAKDFKNFYQIAAMLEHYNPSLQRLKPVSVVQTLEKSTKTELDLRLEGAALSQMAENTKNDEGFSVPKIDWERTGRDVLTMEWIDGVKISDLETLKKNNIDLKDLAKRLVQSFLQHSLRDGFFHADMHPGNLLITKNAEIVALDFGITGLLGQKEKYFLAQILYGFIKRDYDHIAAVHFQAGYVPDDQDVARFAQANRAIGEPIHGHNAQTISMAKLLGLLFEITEIFNMQTRPELILLQKTMVVVEGLARTLDPDFNMWKTAEPVVKNWLVKNAGIAAFSKDIKRNSQSFLQVFHQLPEIMHQQHNILKQLEYQSKYGWQINEKSLTSLTNKQPKGYLRTFLLAIIAACLIALTYKIYSGF